MPLAGPADVISTGPAEAEEGSPGPPGRTRPRLVPGGYDITALPLFVPPAAGEQLASWLVRLAYRYGMPVSQLLTQIGIDLPSAPASRLERQLRRRHAAVLTAAAGIPVLPPDPHASSVGMQVRDLLVGYLLHYHRHERPLPMWIRFCPPCLAGSGGVWLAEWAHPLHLVCVTHQVLLRRTCAECGQARFASTAWMTHDTPAWRCTEPARHRTGQPREPREPRTRYTICGADLRNADLEPADDADVAVQERLLEMAAAASTAPDGTGRTYGGLSASNRDAFDAVLELVFERLADLRPLTSDTAPAGPLLQALRVALEVLDMPDAAAATDTADRHRLLHPAGPVTPIGPDRVLTARRRNPLLASIRLASLHERLSPSTQLVFRSGSGRPRYPSPPSLLARTAAADQAQLAWLPQLIWPGQLNDWIDDRDHRDRAAASMLLAKVGSTRPWRFIALDLGLPADFATYPANLVRYFKHDGHWPEVLRRLDELATRLERDPPPINYQTRRWAAARYDDVIAAVNHTMAYLGPPYRWCHTRLLVELFWQVYTGGDLRLAAPVSGTLLNPDLYHRQEGDAVPLTDPPLLAFFTATAAVLNDATDADTEPLTWQPP